MDEETPFLDEQFQCGQSEKHLIGNDEKDGAETILQAFFIGSIRVKVERTDEQGQADRHKRLHDDQAWITEGHTNR
jgi:hypothetical protein